MTFKAQHSSSSFACHGKTTDHLWTFLNFLQPFIVELQVRTSQVDGQTDGWRKMRIAASCGDGRIINYEGQRLLHCHSRCRWLDGRKCVVMRKFELCSRRRTSVTAANRPWQVLQTTALSRDTAERDCSTFPLPGISLPLRTFYICFLLKRKFENWH